MKDSPPTRDTFPNKRVIDDSSRTSRNGVHSYNDMLGSRRALRGGNRLVRTATQLFFWTHQTNGKVCGNKRNAELRTLSGTYNGDTSSRRRPHSSTYVISAKDRISSGASSGRPQRSHTLHVLAVRAATANQKAALPRERTANARSTRLCGSHGQPRWTASFAVHEVI